MHKVAALLFVFCFILTGFSQSEIYKFKHLSTREGLSQTSAITIIQDNLGQIWIGTRDGLNKYDGSKFTVYRHNRANPLSLSNSDIICLEQDSDGFIWVGTAVGLNKYNPKKDTFKSYFNSANSSSIQDNLIWTIKELSNKELWIGTPLGLSIYDKASDSFTSTLVDNAILSIFETKRGAVFVGTKNGLKQLISKTAKGYYFKTIKGTENLNVQEIIESPNGNLLLGTRVKSVVEYAIETGKVSPYFDEVKLKDKNRNVRKLLFDEKGKLWIGTYDGLQIADKNKDIRVIYSDIDDNETINDNFIKSLFKDRKGSIWVGTYHGGINLWDKSNINFINITQKPRKLGLSFKVVSSIVHHKKLLFFGTEGGGISIFNIDSKTFEYLNTKNTPALKSDNIKALYLTKDNNLWIGTFEDGFVVYNLDTKKFNATTLHPKLVSYLEGVGVYAIQQDTNGDMLLGTIGKGLIRYDVKNNIFSIIDSNSKPNGLLSNFIKSIRVDSKNNIWLSTNKGLNVVNTKGHIKDFFYNKKTQIGYSMTYVFEDSKGIIWTGTESDGLFKLVTNDFRPVDIKLESATSVIGIRSILEDNKGNFWISTVNQGIIYYNPLHNKVIANYTYKQGLASNHYNNNSSLRIGDSNFFFGGPAGAVYFDANKLVKNNYSPQVIITDFKVKNKSIAVNDQTELLSNTITFTKEIELSYEQGNFNISFAIPNFINRNSNHYEYRLKGLEKDWNQTSQNSVSYTIQNPGDYTFEIRGINNDGISNSVPTTLKIHVNPAPWRTWWAFMLYGIFIFGSLYYLLGILKSKAELKHQLDLEKLEAEQTKEVNKAKLEFFTNISHEFRTPLTLILGPLHQILENYSGNSKMYKKLKVIESSANHLLQLINRLMDFRKLENNLVKLETAEGNIVKFLKEIYLSFTEYAKDGNYDYSFETPSDEILVYYDRYKLERVFYNLISNAFRYTPKNGKIMIRIIEEKEKIVIQVEDSGVGVAKEYQDKIFERFFEVSINNKPDNDYNKGTGIGLSIAKNIVDLHKGKISVKSNTDGVGSIFSVELSLGREHLLDEEIIQDFKFSDDLSQYVDQLEEQAVIFENNFLEDLTSHEKQTILLVEDNKQLRKFMRDLLIENYNILEAENGKVAYKIAQQEQVDLIVSDVVMPIMTGTELCSLIKEDVRTSHIPLILLTSRSSLIYKLEGLESGADDYISKPFNVAEFKLRIHNLLTSISRLKQKMSSIDTVSSDGIVLSSLDEKLYKKALQIVENNIGNEQFDVHFFCEELGVSRTVLFKKIKAWTDFTPNDFVQHIRLKKGAQLLEQGKMNISQISYMLGFKNPKYFSKCFSKKFGKTPTEYVKTFLDS
ncbi:two-component regulator propeller domain-containing protein [Flavobacterium sp. NG2]|uniref:two-component regulator propeller domain-containing protein n=1 Tax=Flavobacterium sp. NG2 TaxID=3097547 RepID=UPI002A803CD0|nr:two-component regulator propeller domain-containing protein [Flavobacterium sp. NG2]WPR70104.1 two-component regulator propeller domain-containing protein [Flavobacterium sp. NG2]